MRYAMFPARDRIKLNEQHAGFIIESNDAAVMGCLGMGYRTTSTSRVKPNF